MTNKNDIFKLAGIQNTFSLDDTKTIPDNNDNVKYVLLNVIEKYNDASNNTNLQNSKKLYSDIIKKIDNIIGCIANGDKDIAQQSFNELDKNVRNNILAMDTDDDIKNYMECCQDKEVEYQITNESFKIECEKVSVPSDVMNDLKTAIKELDDGNNYEYISHLSGAKENLLRYQYLKQVLEQLLNYFTNANEISINHATTYLTSLDSDTKHNIPASIWKFLAVNYSNGPSILDRMQNIDPSKKYKPSEIMKPVKEFLKDK